MSLEASIRMTKEMVKTHGEEFYTVSSRCGGTFAEKNIKASEIITSILKKLGFPDGTGLIEAERQITELRQRDPARPSCCASGENGEAD